MDNSEEILGNLGQMTAAAVGMHELYKSFVDAGFTPAQAFELVRTSFAEAIRSATGGNDGS